MDLIFETESSKYEEKIHQFYHEHKHYVQPNVINTIRNKGSFQHKWATIQETMNKFLFFMHTCQIGIKMALVSLTMQVMLAFYQFYCYLLFTKLR